METVTIIIPCYNEAKRLNTDAFLAFTKTQPFLRIIFVNDGSTDNTQQVLDSLVKDIPQYTILSLAKNSGKSEAVRQGIQRALSDGATIVGYFDADLAVPLLELTRLIEYMVARPELFIVLGSRVKLLGYDIRRNILRHYLGRVFATCASLLLDLPVYDTQCGCKLFRAEIAQFLFKDPFRTTWIFDVEVLQRCTYWLYVVRKETRASVERYVHEVPLKSWIDVQGSKIRTHHYLIALKDFFALAFSPYRVR